MPPALREKFAETVKSVVESRMGGWGIPYRVITKQEYDTYVRDRIFKMLRCPKCNWMFDKSAGMATWTNLNLLLNLNGKIMSYEDLASCTSEIVNRSDFFGNCIVGTVVAANKCNKLGLDWEVLIIQAEQESPHL